MERYEAYHILGDMINGSTPEQQEALRMAMNDLEYIDLVVIRKEVVDLCQNF